MSEIVHILGDLSGLAPFAGVWRQSKVDKKAVGKLTKHLGPLQATTTVDDALSSVEQVAGPGGRVAIDAEKGTLSVRAVVTDHQLHDLAAPLIGAFRLAGARGAKGALWLVEGATDSPGFGHRLDVDDTGATVRELKKKGLAEVLEHAGRGDVIAMEEALANAPPAPAAGVDGRPAALGEVSRAERPAYEAAWDFLASADEAVLLAAIAREASWFHPASHLDVDVAKMSAATTKAAALDYLGAPEPGQHRGRLDTMFRLLPWVDAARGTAILAQARAAGTWPPFLADAMRGLLASGDAAAEAEAWAIFEACCEDKQTDLNLWSYRAAGPYAIAQSGAATSDLVAKLDAALKKKTQLAAQKRAEGLCLALAWRGGDEAHGAIDRAVAIVPEKAQRCIVYYAQQNGWKPKS